MNRRFALALLAPLTACTVNVESSDYAQKTLAAEENASLGKNSQALTGGVYFVNCTKDQEAMFRQAMIWGRTIANSDAMAQCIAHQIRYGTEDDSPYDPRLCPGDPYSGSSLSTIIAKAQAIATSINAVQIDCDTDGLSHHVNGNDQHEYGYSGAEEMEIHPGPVTLSGVRNENMDERLSSLASRAGQVWHEAMHVHDYDDCGVGIGYDNAIPELMKRCVIAVSDASSERCDVVDSCGAGATLSLVDSYPATSNTRCECVRDTLGHVLERSPVQSTPRLGTNDEGDQFGAALAAGDFNGDGFDDLAVGAPGEYLRTGKTYIFYGSVFGLYAGEVISMPYITELGEDEFGHALAAADFNDDDIDDLAVGAPGYEGNQGAVFLYRGTRDGLVRQRDLLQTGISDNAVGDRFGWALATGRFFTSGAHVALAVGAPGEVLSGVRSGMVAVFGGVSSNDLLKPWGIVSEPSSARGEGDNFGAAIAIGRLHADGNGLVVGAPSDGQGKVHVFDARAFGSTVPNHVGPRYAITPYDNEARWFGYSLAMGVGFEGASSSIAIGAPLRSNATGGGRGGVYVAKDNRQNGGSYVWVTAWAGNPQTALGWSLAKINNESFSQEQLLIGAPGEDGGRIYRQSPAGLFTNYHEIRSQAGLGMNEAGDSFGSALAVGDFDADGHQDWVAAAVGEAPGSDPKSGAVFAYHWSEEKVAFTPMASHTQTD